MKQKIIMTLLIILILILLASCLNPFLPVYEKTETEEDGVCAIIDGVKYKELPEIKWFINVSERIIGFAGDKNTLVYEGFNDPDKNFVILQHFFSDHFDSMLYRTDKIIPEPSADVVDKIMWDDHIMGSDQKNSEEHTYTTEDKDVIKELFEVLENGNKTSNYNLIRKGSKTIIMSIGCYSSKLPGAYYVLNIGISNGKIVCGDSYEKEYVEIPIDLLEKLAGKKIDISEFTEE